jgi:hypothetical protein
LKEYQINMYNSPGKIPATCLVIILPQFYNFLSAGNLISPHYLIFRDNFVITSKLIMYNLFSLSSQKHFQSDRAWRDYDSVSPSMGFDRIDCNIFCIIRLDEMNLSFTCASFVYFCIITLDEVNLLFTCASFVYVCTIG